MADVQYTVEFNAQMDIDTVVAQLKKLKESFTQIVPEDHAFTKQFEKAFDQIINSSDKLSEKVRNGLKSATDAKSVEKNIASIKNGYESIQMIIDKMKQNPAKFVNEDTLFVLRNLQESLVKISTMDASKPIQELEEKLKQAKNDLGPMEDKAKELAGGLDEVKKQATLTADAIKTTNKQLQEAANKRNNFSEIQQTYKTLEEEANKYKKQLEDITANEEKLKDLQSQKKNLISSSGKANTVGSAKQIEATYESDLNKRLAAAQKSVDSFSKKKDGTIYKKDEEKYAAATKNLEDLKNEKKLWEDLQAAIKEAQDTKQRYYKDYGKTSDVEKKSATADKKLAESKAEPQSVEEYDAKIKQLNQDLDTLKQKKKEYDATMKESESATAAVDKQKQNIEDLSKELEDAEGKQGEFNKELESFKLGVAALTGIDASKLPNDLNQLQQILNTINTEAVNKAKSDINGMSEAAEKGASAANNLGAKSEQAASDVGMFDERLSDASAFINRIKYFFSLNNAMMLFRRAIRSTISTITELDATMTETAVVTDYTVSDMWDQLGDYTKRANELGVSINDAYEAATLYYQQGLKTNQVQAVSNETLKMARIAGLEAADATDRELHAA